MSIPTQSKSAVIPSQLLLDPVRLENHETQKLSLKNKESGTDLEYRITTSKHGQLEVWLAKPASAEQQDDFILIETNKIEASKSIEASFCALGDQVQYKDIAGGLLKQVGFEVYGEIINSATTLKFQLCEPLSIQEVKELSQWLTPKSIAKLYSSYQQSKNPNKYYLIDSLHSAIPAYKLVQTLEEMGDTQMRNLLYCSTSARTERCKDVVSSLNVDTAMRYVNLNDNLNYLMLFFHYLSEFNPEVGVKVLANNTRPKIGEWLLLEKKIEIMLPYINDLPSELQQSISQQLSDQCKARVLNYLDEANKIQWLKDMSASSAAHCLSHLKKSSTFSYCMHLFSQLSLQFQVDCIHHFSEAQKYQYIQELKLEDLKNLISNGECSSFFNYLSNERKKCILDRLTEEQKLTLLLNGNEIETQKFIFNNGLKSEGLTKHLMELSKSEFKKFISFVDFYPDPILQDIIIQSEQLTQRVYNSEGENFPFGLIIKISKINMPNAVGLLLKCKRSTIDTVMTYWLNHMLMNESKQFVLFHGMTEQQLTSLIWMLPAHLMKRYLLAIDEPLFSIVCPFDKFDQVVTILSAKPQPNDFEILERLSDEMKNKYIQEVFPESLLITDLSHLKQKAKWLNQVPLSHNIHILGTVSDELAAQLLCYMDLNIAISLFESLDFQQQQVLYKIPSKTKLIERFSFFRHLTINKWGKNENYKSLFLFHLTQVSQKEFCQILEDVPNELLIEYFKIQAVREQIKTLKPRCFEEHIVKLPYMSGDRLSYLSLAEVGDEEINLGSMALIHQPIDHWYHVAQYVPVPSVVKIFSGLLEASLCSIHDEEWMNSKFIPAIKSMTFSRMCEAIPLLPTQMATEVLFHLISRPKDLQLEPVKKANGTENKYELQFSEDSFICDLLISFDSRNSLSLLRNIDKNKLSTLISNIRPFSYDSLILKVSTECKFLLERAK
ncbi:hypothetical protein D5R81_16935 [Parashewanella spongiae]|uniref:Uncharacterized protein n=1 Tax=Parashewanella spongiae TaxID=342950 RepID=A0A3A6TQI1_9GAMM|nr:hypothetical protein [Parashewanella spongiae]MCL1079634.1 hypothetical protein [Parashewanella spongiae]RJY06978.1 hypothetical protein D5R81_16935 [Parashewanella spongiae]